MTSILRFPYESSDGAELDISYNWFRGDVLDGIMFNHITLEMTRWIEKPRNWQFLWYFRHVHLVGVKKPERMYSRRLRLFDSLVDKLR